MVADELSAALLKHYGNGKKMFAPVENLNHAVLWFLGNKQEFSKAWSHLLSCCLQLCHTSEHTEKHVSSLLVLLRVLCTLNLKDLLDVDLELSHWFMGKRMGFSSQIFSPNPSF